MATVEQEILIEAPPEKVTDYLDDPTVLPEIWPSMVKITNVEALPNGGHRYHWDYKMAGFRFEGDSETVEYEPGRHFVQKNTGQIPSTFDWKFVPENGSTKVVMKAEYEIPKTLLGKLTEPFILKLNEREAETVMRNLKDRIEA